MSAQTDNHIKPFTRFPFVKPEQARQLARALDFEASAGRSVMDGELEQAEDWREQARVAWTRYREAGR